MILRRCLPALLAGLALTACGGDPNGGGPVDGSAVRIEVAGGDALTWGDGDYGVVLAHGAAFDAASWAEQATRIADSGATVIAVEDTDPESLEAAVEQLRSEGIDDVALIGGSAGADAILQLAREQPGLPDQMILLSPNGVVDGLGEEPKLFVASEDEPVAEVSTELADSAPGEDNEALILPGSAHAQNIFDPDQSDQGERVLQAILDRIQEYAAA